MTTGGASRAVSVVATFSTGSGRAWAGVAPDAIKPPVSNPASRALTAAGGRTPAV
ncbi:MAG: hypothetical protein JWN91_1711, partial [Nocardioides sp.]|nr:hypothetical protein [Nocardioides sp.]